MRTPATTSADLEKHVVHQFILTGKDMTVAEIASGMGVSEATVRKIINNAHGCPDGLRCDQISRPSREKNYNTEHGYHRVWVYGPTRETLRRLLVEMLAEERVAS